MFVLKQNNNKKTKHLIQPFAVLTHNADAHTPTWKVLFEFVLICGQTDNNIYVVYVHMYVHSLI